MRALILPGQRRLHFTSERDSRRRQILGEVLDLGITALLYQAKAKPPKMARDACLTRLVADLVDLKPEWLVLEQEDATLRSDRSLLYTQVHACGLQGSLRYRHLRSHEEVLLSIPDALAWCWARGGRWRREISRITKAVRTV